MITRRTFLAGNAAVVASSTFGLQPSEPTAAQDNGHGGLIQEGQLPRSHRDFWNDWPNSMIQQMNNARQARRALLAKIQSKEDVADRTETVRSQLWKLLGGRPEETPLNPRITGAVERNGYRVEKLIFESMPRVYVTANVYVPTVGKPPFPAILAPLGHSANGKAAMRYQYTYQTLARKGYVVITWDPFGQGERIQYLQPGTNHTRMHQISMEHTQAGRPMILFGNGFALYLAWDGIRALDYLLTRPEVDATRIGCTGQSGGGTMTMFLGALDPRIHAAVAIEGNFANLAGPFYDPPGSISDVETDIIGSLPLRMDRGDLLAAFAPKPFLICYTKHDEGETYGPVNTEATIESYDDVARIYEICDAKERVELFAGNLPHGMDYFSRRAVYGWFNRWFNKLDAGVEEAEYDSAPDTLLNATETGQVSSSLNGRSVVQLNSDRAKELFPRSPFRSSPADPSPAIASIRTVLRQLLTLPSERTALRPRIVSSNIRKNQNIQEIQFESEPGIRIPGWLIVPSGVGGKRPCVLYISNGYADEAVAEPGPFDEVISQGYTICAIDIRGTGISAVRPPRGGPNFYRQMDLGDRFALANFVLGPSAIGQRVWDVLRAIDYLAELPGVDNARIHLLGQEEAGLAALMAAVLDDRVQSTLLAGMVVSYMSIVESTNYSLPLEWFVPGILQHFDIPDLSASLYPRPVRILNAVDAVGDSLPEAYVRRYYSSRLSEDSVTLKSIHILQNDQIDHSDYIQWLK